MESSAQEIHENLNAVIDYQTHHRLRETQGRHRAEELNERIMVWSVFVTVAIFFVGIGQVREQSDLDHQSVFFLSDLGFEIILRWPKAIDVPVFFSGEGSNRPPRMSKKIFKG